MPTVVNNTIGTGGDYSNDQNWEAATDNDLVTADEQHNGRILEAQSGGLGFAGATTDATRYRQLMYDDPADEYDPDTGSGFLMDVIYQIEENYFRMLGVAVTSSATYCFRCQELGIIVDRCYGINTGTSYAIGMSANADQCVVRNSIFQAQATTSGAINTTAGITGANTYQNVTFYNVHATGDGWDNNDRTMTVTNVIGMVTGTGIVFEDTTGMTFTTCLSTDATGGDSTTRSVASIVADAGGGDFTPTAAGPAEDSGTDLSGSFTLDYYGNTHDGDGSGWEIGAINADTAGGGSDAVPVSIINRRKRSFLRKR